jgi:hypothetical protein
VKKKEQSKILSDIDPIIKMDTSKKMVTKISNIPVKINTDDLNNAHKPKNFFVNDFRLNSKSNHNNSSFFSSKKKYSNSPFIIGFILLSFII